MHLLEVLESHATKTESGVPDWILGAFRRSFISFFDGTTDRSTNVFWLQSRTFTIDLRLRPPDERVPSRPWADYSLEELRELGNHEGWCADSTFDGLLSWSGGVSLQLHNRWAEPAELRRVGDCMMEFCPSSAYVEDWRLLSTDPGPLVGLRLLEEVDDASGEVLHRGGGLIIAAAWAGLVRGRPTPVHAAAPNAFREMVVKSRGDGPALEALFGCETSVGRGSLNAGFRVEHSTHPARVGQDLLSLEGFEPTEEGLIQRIEEGGRTVTRRFSVDTLEAHFPFSRQTPTDEEASAWFERERETLSRYSK